MIVAEMPQQLRTGFLAGYRGLTREAYTLDLRQVTGWQRPLDPIR